VGRAIAIPLAKQGASAPDGGWRALRCAGWAWPVRPGTRTSGKPTASRLLARCSHHRPVRD